MSGLRKAGNLLAVLSGVLQAMGESLRRARGAGLRRNPGVPSRVDDQRGSKAFDEAYDEEERWEFWR